MTTTEFIKQKYNISPDQKSPIFLEGSRFKEFPTILKELGFVLGAEIGVSKGFYAKALFIKIRKLKLFLVDSWTAYGDYVEQHDEKGQIQLNGHLEKTKERLAGFNYEIIRKTSMEAVKDFEDESLDFVFIDGNHSFEYVVEDIAKWSKKVKKGGIVAGHDYWNSSEREDKIYMANLTAYEKMKLCQVKDAIDAYTKTNQIKDWFVFNGDNSPSWMYEKQ